MMLELKAEFVGGEIICSGHTKNVDQLEAIMLMSSAIAHCTELIDLMVEEIQRERKS